MTSPLTLVSCAATAENAVTATFNEAVYFSQLLDAEDGSNPLLYTLAPVAGTVGIDGNSARPVSVVATSVDATGALVTLYLDRPMTPWPSKYLLTAAGVWSADQTQELVSGTATTFGTYRTLVPPQQDAPAPTRDFANPQTLAEAQGSTLSQPLQSALGSFGYSDDHDYAIDQGEAGFHKRVMRRIFTRKGGFAFLPGYGAGAPTYAKKLGKASVRDQLAADVEAQVAQEPEVSQVTAAVRPDPTRPGLFRLSLFIQKKTGRTSRFSTLVNATG